MSKRRTPPTDREQLDKAFVALMHKGYYARARYWCCNSCALADIPEEYSEKYVFWHEQADDYAFGEGDSSSDDAWKQQNTLLHPLFLNWAGDAREIISTMREFGFSVEFDGSDIEHVDPARKIRILPGRIPIN